MDDSGLAKKIRKQFAAKKKAGQDFGRVYIANSVTLATRVRVDIMRAIAKRYNSDTEEMFVTSFNSRPTLHTRQKQEGLRTMAYTFSDALSRYGADLTVEELGEV